MKNIKSIIFINLLLILFILMSPSVDIISNVDYFTLKETARIIIFTLIIVFFVFNLTVRKKVTFKPYFTHPLNLFTLKHSKSYSLDLPQDLLLEKVEEVLKLNGCSVVYRNNENNQLMATTKFNLLSWGENIYISTLVEDGKTKLDFCSASVFSLTWGRNKRNFERLVQSLDNALTI